MSIGTFIEKSFYATAPEGTVASTVLVDGQLLRADTLFKVSGVAALTNVIADTSVPGVKVTYVWKFRMPEDFTTAMRMRIRFRWTMSAPGPATTTGRWNLIVKKSGVAIPTTSNVNTPTRNIAAGGPFPYTEDWIAFDIPKTTWAAGETFDINLSFELVAAAAGAATTSLDIDPSVAGAEFVVEFDH
jgi:hypothetical protein